MRVLRSLDDLRQPLRRPALTIGNFDGVHRAHQRILRHVLEHARKLNGEAAAMTFDPHPARLLTPRKAPPLLTTLEQRIGLLEAAGLHAAIVLPFTRELAHLSPVEFVREVLLERLRVELVCIGKNFRFGHKQAGHAETLAKLGREFGFAVRIIPPVVVQGRPVSSTRVRRLVGSGQVGRAARLLGRPYALTGEVRKGFGRGGPLGFPTLNLESEQECLPARGVYVTETVLEGQVFPSATSVGVNPTFDGEKLVVESHLLDFARQVDRGRLEVRFRERLRAEKRFPSAEALKKEMERDLERTRRYFRRRIGARSARRVPAES